MTQKNLSTKQAHRRRDQTCGCLGGGEKEQAGLGAWD